MKRKIFTFTAAAALAAALTVQANAAETNCKQFVWDCPTLEQFCQMICPIPECPPCVPEIPDTDDTPVVPAPPVEDETPELPTPPVEDETPEVPEIPDTEDAPEAPVPPVEDEIPEETPEQSPEIDAMSQLEQAACTLINQRRAENGLEPLAISADLSVKARIKSQDMRDNNYFDHNSPTYGSPFDLMQSLGITYRTAGENIAMGYKTAEAVVDAWMNSPGHRANILSTNYTTMGIGFVDGYWTQWFIG